MFKTGTGRKSNQYFLCVCIISTIVVSGFPAVPQEIGYGFNPPVSDKPPAPSAVITCKGTSYCTDASGQRIRLSREQMRDNRRTGALRTLGCTTRAIGTGPATAEEIACMQRYFGLAEGPLDHISRSLLDALILGNLDQNLAIARRRGHIPGGGSVTTAGTRGSAINAGDIVGDHPDAAMFVHPVNKRVWDAVSFGDLHTALSGDRGNWTEARWPNLTDMAGREYSVMGKGIPLFVVRFESKGGEIETPEGSVHTASYDNAQGFDCIPGAQVLQGKCFGIAIQAPAGGRGVWRLRPAFRGDQGPILFGQLVEDRAAFDEAKADQSIAETVEVPSSPSVPVNVLAEELPLTNVEPSVAYYANLIYDEPTAPDTEFVSQARIPFLAYHAAYAQACAHNFDGSAEIWRDVGNRLIESSDVPGNRFRVYEEYIRTEMPIQADAYMQFALSVEEWRLGWLSEAGQAQVYYPILADYLEMLDRRFAEWWSGWAQVIEITGCRGPTVDRLEKNLAVSHSMISG